MAKRIQRKRTKGWRTPEGALCVTRPGRWGNPWRAVQRPETGSWYVARANVPGRPGRKPYLGVWCGSPAEATRKAIDYFVRWVRLFRIDLAPLRGRDLACYCAPWQACHADALIELANKET